jgi:hypothetical protein
MNTIKIDKHQTLIICENKKEFYTLNFTPKKLLRNDALNTYAYATAIPYCNSKDIDPTEG